MNVKTLIITGFGINSDYELAECFNRAGSTAERVHINDLIDGKRQLDEFHIAAFPGGFSFGDHLGSGRVFANKFSSRLGDSIRKFAASGRPIIGICNGFQVLVKMGLLPTPDLVQRATLMQNESGLFEDRWVKLGVNKGHNSLWLKGVDSIDVPIRHGEGRFIADNEMLNELEANRQDALFYLDENGQKTQNYPLNPNGSTRAIAGITDKTGNILGLMPHPEAFLFQENHPLFKRGVRGIEGSGASLLKEGDGAGMVLFYNAVSSVK